jgi:DNA-binding transcriptional LysR family regulator
MSAHLRRTLGPPMKHNDLNLLTYLDLLVKHGSATRVAEIMGVSQPAVSAAIRRLRAMADHPLFVRSGRELTPTAYATSLQEQFAPLLKQWNLLVAGKDEFDAGSSGRGFTILASDYTQYLFLPLLARRLARRAPGVTLKVIPSNPYRGVQLVEQQHVDMGIGYYRSVPPQLTCRAILEEQAVCIIAKSHPALDAFDALAYTTYPHIAIASENAAYSATLEQALAAHRIKRRVAIVMPSYVAAAHIVEQTQYIATLPRSIAEVAAKTCDIVIRPCVFPLPTLDLSILSHSEAHTDAGNQWFQGLVAECATEISSGWATSFGSTDARV